MDLNNLVLESFKDLENSGKIKKIIDEETEKLCREAVKSFFGYDSTFRKNLKIELDKSLSVNTKNLTLPGYFEMICDYAKESIHKAISEQHKEFVDKELNGFFKPIEKKEWSISEIIERFKNHTIEEMEEENIQRKEVTIIFEYDDSCYGKYMHLYLDSRKNIYKFNCEYRIAMSEKGIYDLQTESNVNHNKNLLKRFVYVNSDFDKFLYKLSSMGDSLIIVDDFDESEHDIICLGDYI